MGGATLSFCQWHVKMGLVFLPIGTRWWNNQIEAVNCSLSRTFKLFPHTVSPSFTSTASALPPPQLPHLLRRVPGVSERLRRHIAASPVPAELWRGLGGDGINETCSPGATFRGGEGRRVVATWIIQSQNITAAITPRSGDKKPPATSGPPLSPLSLSAGRHQPATPAVTKTGRCRNGRLPPRREATADQWRSFGALMHAWQL